MPDLATPESTRAFLRLRLNPGIGRTRRTVNELARVMPSWLSVALRTHAPELAQLHEAVAEAEAAAAKKREAYAKALGTWIAQDAGR